MVKLMERSSRFNIVIHNRLPSKMQIEYMQESCCAYSLARSELYFKKKC